jgi:hypothetical protein
MTNPHLPSLKNALLTIAKQPSPGQAKTLLTSRFSPGQAAALYACFLQDTRFDASAYRPRTAFPV